MDLKGWLKGSDLAITSEGTWGIGSPTSALCLACLKFQRDYCRSVQWKIKMKLNCRIDLSDIGVAQPRITTVRLLDIFISFVPHLNRRRSPRCSRLSGRPSLKSILFSWATRLPSRNRLIQMSTQPMQEVLERVAKRPCEDPSTISLLTAIAAALSGSSCFEQNEG